MKVQLSEMSTASISTAQAAVAALASRCHEVGDRHAQLWLLEWCSETTSVLAAEVAVRVNAEHPASVKGSIARLEDLANDRDKPGPGGL